MADASWGSGWPTCDRSKIVTIVRHDGLRLPIHRDLADLVSLLMDLTELMGYDIRPDWTWGYACRPIANTSTPSNHSWGTAVDINAPANPRRQRGLPMITNIPRKVVDLWKAHGFRWGGDFAWPDPMHMEFMGTVAQARATVARLRAFLAGAPAPPAPVGRPVLPGVAFPGTVGLNDSGEAVKTWQRLLRARGYAIAVDGVFGLATNHVVVDWQRRHHPPLDVDGAAGPATWHSLQFA
jgi:peptidoglycan hydrolase-like protein with peptidoglycan-binding domain